MPLLRRRPVLRTVAETAVIAGTASVVGGRVRRHQNNKYAQQDAEAAQTQQPAPIQDAAPAGDDMVHRLKELAKLRDEGILTDAEFAAQKAKILA